MAGGTPEQPITRLLAEWRGGRDEALRELMPLVYDELRRLAGAQMRGERAGHTLQPTALVHEAFARLVGANVNWQDRAHFLGVTTRMEIVAPGSGQQRPQQRLGLRPPPTRVVHAREVMTGQSRVRVFRSHQALELLSVLPA